MKLPISDLAITAKNHQNIDSLFGGKSVIRYVHPTFCYECGGLLSKSRQKKYDIYTGELKCMLTCTKCKILIADNAADFIQISLR